MIREERLCWRCPAAILCARFGTGEARRHDVRALDHLPARSAAELCRPGLCRSTATPGLIRSSTSKCARCRRRWGWSPPAPACHWCRRRCAGSGVMTLFISTRRAQDRLAHHHDLSGQRQVAVVGTFPEAGPRVRPLDARSTAKAERISIARAPPPSYDTACYWHKADEVRALRQCLLSGEKQTSP